MCHIWARIWTANMKWTVCLELGVLTQIGREKRVWKHHKVHSDIHIPYVK